MHRSAKPPVTHRQDAELVELEDDVHLFAWPTGEFVVAVPHVVSHVIVLAFVHVYSDAVGLAHASATATHWAQRRQPHRISRCSTTIIVDAKASPSHGTWEFLGTMTS